MAKLKKGTKVIYPLWDKAEIATVTFYNPFSGEVGIRYKGKKGEVIARIDDLKIV